mmetsp:Transcript_29150/g.58238  ORF Transcript_29150/g.58238 Transcript_29150/m.58238 type:complete len:224 (+) Transcript_29150:89-760(+)
MTKEVVSMAIEFQPFPPKNVIQTSSKLDNFGVQTHLVNIYSKPHISSIIIILNIHSAFIHFSIVHVEIAIISSSAAKLSTYYLHKYPPLIPQTDHEVFLTLRRHRRPPSNPQRTHHPHPHRRRTLPIWNGPNTPSDHRPHPTCRPDSSSDHSLSHRRNRASRDGNADRFFYRDRGYKTPYDEHELRDERGLSLFSRGYGKHGLRGHCTMHDLRKEREGWEGVR